MMTYIKEEPLISVIIPFYSKECGLLARSVISALNQTHANTEIIIVDDRSPVAAVDELRDIKDDRLKILINEENKNGAYSRTRGISEAKGEFVALLDADDYWRPEHLEKSMRGIHDADFLYSNI